MNIGEIIQIQKASGGKQLFLQKEGVFYHGVEDMAFLLSEILGYKLRHKKCKNGMEYILAGFHISQIEKVLGKLKEKGAVVEEESGSEIPLPCYNIKFEGKIEKKEVPVVQTEQKKVESKTANMEVDVYKAVYDTVMAFEIAEATPMQAMNLINDIKMTYGKKR